MLNSKISKIVGVNGTPDLPLNDFHKHTRNLKVTIISKMHLPDTYLAVKKKLVFFFNSEAKNQKH